MPWLARCVVDRQRRESPYRLARKGPARPLEQPQAGLECRPRDKPDVLRRLRIAVIVNLLGLPSVAVLTPIRSATGDHAGVQ